MEILGIRDGKGKGFLFLGAATWGQRGVNATGDSPLTFLTILRAVRLCWVSFGHVLLAMNIEYDA